MSELPATCAHVFGEVFCVKCGVSRDEALGIANSRIAELDAEVAERDRDHEMLVRALRNMGLWEVDDLLDRYPYAALVGNNASVNGMPPVPSDGGHHIHGCPCEFCGEA